LTDGDVTTSARHSPNIVLPTSLKRISFDVGSTQFDEVAGCAGAAFAGVAATLGAAAASTFADTFDGALAGTSAAHALNTSPKPMSKNRSNIFALLE
jgi:hypothetical protein